LLVIKGMEELTRREKLMRKLSNYYGEAPKVGGGVSETINFKTNTPSSTVGYDITDPYSMGIEDIEHPKAYRRTGALLPTDKADKFWQYPINKEFEPILDPDVSRNAWADNPYKERYVGNPAVENFLIENKGLRDQGDLIYSEAAKGNLDPYIQYQQRLKNEGILPDSAEKVYQVGKEWMDEQGFGGTNFEPRENAFNSSDPAGLADAFEHEAFSHAYPEKYFGRVDKSIPEGFPRITAAEEMRASFLDKTFAGGDNDFYGDIFERDLGTDGGIYEPGFGIGAEADTFADLYVQKNLKKPIKDKSRRTELADTKPLRGSKDLPKEFKAIGPEVYLEDMGREPNPYMGYSSDDYYPLTVDQQFRAAALKRFPGIDMYDQQGNFNPNFKEGVYESLVEENLKPYAADVKKAQQVGLFDKAKAGLTKYLKDQVKESTDDFVKNRDKTVPLSVAEVDAHNARYIKNQSDLLRKLYDNSYFAVSPDMVAAKVLADNWRGGVVGAGASLLNPEVANRVREDDYLGATHEFGKDVAIGAGTEAGLKGLGGLGMRFAPGFTKAVAPYVGGALNVLGPTVAMAGAFSQGHPNSLTNVVVDKAANTPFGLKVNPETDAGKRAGDFLANQARNVWSRIRGL